MDWYEREIKKYSVDINTKIYAWIIIALSFSIYFYFTKWVYQWESIEIIPFVPWVWWLISALTYLTIWKLFYKSKVIYMPLYFIFVVILKDKKTYKKIKNNMVNIMIVNVFFLFTNSCIILKFCYINFL